MTDEHLYYHSVAVAAHGEYHTVQKYGRGAKDWEEAYYKLKDEDVAVPQPRHAYETLEELGLRLVMSAEQEFPERLRHIPHAPFGLYVRGELAKSGMNDLTLAIVGTRRASGDGKKIARQFGRDLARAGFTIASGLAFGIDAAAHEGCLDAKGVTIAVLAGGLDNVYPGTHAPLAKQILAQGGALISEYPPGEPPLPHRFIERNRIISGISRGVLIVEAPESSGALATARYAVEQNRDVFVTPGSLAAGNFKGSHALIRQGAEFVSSPDDIMDAYGISKKEILAADERHSSPEEILILKALTEILFPADVDKLADMTKLEPRIINRALTTLIIRGIIKESGGGYTIN